MTWRAWNVRGRLSKLRAPTVCSHLHSCSQYCRLVDFGLCALAKHSPRSSLNLQQGCIGMTQVTHNCACTTVYIQCNGLSIYSAVFESTYGCYPTKWQLGQKPLLLIWHANNCFSSTLKLWTYHSCFRSGNVAMIFATTLCCYQCGTHDNQPLAMSSLRWISCTS